VGKGLSVDYIMAAIHSGDFTAVQEAIDNAAVPDSEETPPEGEPADNAGASVIDKKPSEDIPVDTGNSICNFAHGERKNIFKQKINSLGYCFERQT